MVSPLNIIRESPASYTIKGLEMFHHTYHNFALSWSHTDVSTIVSKLYSWAGNTADGRQAKE